MSPALATSRHHKCTRCSIPLTSSKESGRSSTKHWATRLAERDRHVELFTRVNFLQYYLRRGTLIGLKYWTTTTVDPETTFFYTVISVLHVAVELEVETWTRALKIANSAWWFQRSSELIAVHTTNAE